MGKIIYAADLFCGAGGTSTGLQMATEAMGKNLRLIAVNHWRRAVETHAANHPGAEHFCTGLDALKPSRAVPGGQLDLLIASPECTHHSVARGGKPCNDQSRSSAWHVLHWCQELYVRNLIIENVPEFTSWGPLGVTGKPLKSLKGKTFQAFITVLKSLGYSINWQIANCADYGDATTRRRFFLLASRGNRRVRWPDQSHAPQSSTDMFGQTLKSWKPAREIIDWSIPGHSIFLDPEDVKKAGLKIKRPLAKNTLMRIEAGIRKFWGEWAEPFLVILYGTNNSRSIDKPFPTITAGGTHIGLCRPFVTIYKGMSKNRSIDKGLPTLTTNPHLYLCEPFIIPQHSGGSPRGVSNPISTICTESGISLITPFVIPAAHAGGDRAQSVKQPLSTIVSKPDHSVLNPFIVKYYGRSKSVSITKPLDTVTTDDRFGLVRPKVVRVGGETYLLDILFRMLTPAELAAAHSFPADYHFIGNKSEIVKQIGNSVPVKTARALCKSRLAA